MKIQCSKCGSSESLQEPFINGVCVDCLRSTNALTPKRHSDTDPAAAPVATSKPSSPILNAIGGMVVLLVLAWFIAGQPSSETSKPDLRTPLEIEASKRLDEFEQETRIQDEMAAEALRRELMPHVDPAERRRIIPSQ